MIDLDDVKCQQCQLNDVNKEDAVDVCDECLFGSLLWD